MSNVNTTISQNLKRIHGRIEAACARVHRDPSEVTLVAVTKYAEDEWVAALRSLGLSQLGESRPQQLVPRSEQFDAEIKWHMIGHLQRNKVRPVLPIAELIHSVDTVRLLSRIDLIAGELSLKPRLLLEVNISGEESKHGFTRDDLLNHWSEITEFSHVDVSGLMTMAPRTDNEDIPRTVFNGLRSLRDELAVNQDNSLTELSMGMSNDFELAIECGATIIRVGSSLYSGL